MFSGHTAGFKIGVSKVQDFGNFELSYVETNEQNKNKNNGQCIMKCRSGAVENCFLFFNQIIYLVSTQRNCLNELVEK